MVLLWLLPPVVVTLAAMVWVAWLGREGRGEVDRDVALARMGAVLEGRRRGLLRRRPSVPTYAAPEAPHDRSTGVAVRPSRPVPPRAVPSVATRTASPAPSPAPS
ncbi:hypothetical protein, partial [Nocardioides dongxiaopingii]|uniref:hypothetical protein n=1 Tax=Nocardioides dongxiaopingii TaxID=2576036 RepID=UPI001BAFD8D3